MSFINMMYPVFNRDRVTYTINDNYLRIGADDDDVVEIHGNVAFWQQMIAMMDGSKTVEEIGLLMEKRCQLSFQKTVSFIRQFKGRNLVELMPDRELNTPYRNYYRSAYTYYSSTGRGGLSLLEKLRNLKITVLGCGGGGSHIAFQLAQLGVGNIHLVDPDVVSEGNVNRQALFTISDIGRLKVDVTQKALCEKNPYIEVTTSDKRMNCTDDVMNEIKGSDWVFCAMDEPPYIAQRITNRACNRQGIPSVYCFSQKSAGKMFMVNPGKTGCVDCLMIATDNEHFRLLTKKISESKQDIITANIYPNIALLCAWVVKKWLDVFCGKDETQDVWNTLYRFDFNTFKEESFLRFKREKNCPTCGNSKKKGLTGLWEVLNIETNEC